MNLVAAVPLAEAVFLGSITIAAAIVVAACACRWGQKRQDQNVTRLADAAEGLRRELYYRRVGYSPPQSDDSEGVA